MGTCLGQFLDMTVNLFEVKMVQLFKLDLNLKAKSIICGTKIKKKSPFS